MSDLSKAARIVNRRDLATLCNVSLPTVDTWVARGCPFVERGSKGKEWKFDLALISSWRVEEATRDAVAGYADENGNVSKDEADRRRAVALAVMAEIETDQLLGSVVALSDAQELMAAFCQVLKAGLDNASSKIAARAASMNQAVEIQEMCFAEFNRAFEAAKAGFEAWLAGNTQSPANPDDF